MKQKLFKRENIVDGNKILAEIQARREQPGRITGEISRPPMPEPTQRPVSRSESQPDEGYRNFAQTYEYETGEMPSYSDYQEYQRDKGD